MANKIKRGSIIIAVVAVIACWGVGGASAAPRPSAGTDTTVIWFAPDASWGEGF